ncbi:hypothetical protein EVAR_27527_1 [Eumeta japonica]|uniref:Serine protease gd N-terminal domain-containing protein n=1 Tax=Eumeta variegata TaxID=151549 RepID=A0A4C1W4L1_EUMVA|nr:hypothetical protein EVAR_27527_1 [Eumeta japonica]
MSRIKLACEPRNVGGQSDPWALATAEERPLLAFWWLLMLVVLLTNGSQGQIASPCPSVFTYELVKNETDRWYGVVQLYTDYTLHGLWLNVLLDKKAHILGASKTTIHSHHYSPLRPLA